MKPANQDLELGTGKNDSECLLFSDRLRSEQPLQTVLNHGKLQLRKIQHPLLTSSYADININKILSWVVVAHTFDPSTWKAEQPGLQDKLLNRWATQENPVSKSQ